MSLTGALPSLISLPAALAHRRGARLMPDSLLTALQYYGAGAATLAALLVVWEFCVARHRERDACFRVFLHNHWVGMAIFAGIAAHYALPPVTELMH